PSLREKIPGLTRKELSVQTRRFKTKIKYRGVSGPRCWQRALSRRLAHSCPHWARSPMKGLAKRVKIRHAGFYVACSGGALYTSTTPLTHGGNTSRMYELLRTMISVILCSF